MFKRLQLSYKSTDPSEKHTLLFLNDNESEQLMQSPTRIPYILGDKPNFLNLFLTSNASA